MAKRILYELTFRALIYENNQRTSYKCQNLQIYGLKFSHKVYVFNKPTLLIVTKTVFAKFLNLNLHKYLAINVKPIAFISYTSVPNLDLILATAFKKFKKQKCTVKTLPSQSS